MLRRGRRNEDRIELIKAWGHAFRNGCMGIALIIAVWQDEKLGQALVSLFVQ